MKSKDDVLHDYIYNHFECEICKGSIPFFDARNQEILRSFSEYRMKNTQGIPSADLNVLNFERIKWGGIRLHDLIYCMLDLEAFLKLEITDPTDKDISFFNQILEAIKGCEANDAPNQLEKRIAELTERSLSNKAERSRIIEILSNLHILRPSKVRPDRGSKNDWGFVQHWRGEDSYSKEAVERYFGRYL